MVDAEIFSRRLDALAGYLERLRRLGEATQSEYLAEPGIHDLAARYLHLAAEAAIDLANHWIAERGLRTELLSNLVYGGLFMRRLCGPR